MDLQYVRKIVGLTASMWVRSVDSFLGLIKNSGSAVEDVQECEDPGAL